MVFMVSIGFGFSIRPAHRTRFGARRAIWMTKGTRPRIGRVGRAGRVGRVGGVGGVGYSN